MIERSCVRTGARVRYYNTIDLVNRLEAETRAGRIAEHLSRLDLVILDGREIGVPRCMVLRDRSEIAIGDIAAIETLEGV